MLLGAIYYLGSLIYEVLVDEMHYIQNKSGNRLSLCAKFTVSSG